MLHGIIDFLVPNRCVCGSILSSRKTTICQRCWPKAEFVSNNICECCGYPFEYEMGSNVLCPECIRESPKFDKARFIFKYNEFSGRYITQLKYGDKTPYAKTLSIWMSEKLNDFPDMDMIVSVPIDRKRLIKRKYNQSALLANRLAKLSGKRSDNLILKKIKNIPQQASLSRAERIKNVKGAFGADAKRLNSIKGQNILLVDDVMTTGATVSECAHILKKNGAAKVYVLTAARTMLDS